MINVAGGWHTHLGILVDRLNERLNERVPPSFWSAPCAAGERIR
jgi:hypothetical protein